MDEDMAPNGDWLTGFLRRTEDLLVSNTQRIIAIEKRLDQNDAWWREFRESWETAWARNEDRWRQNEERWRQNEDRWQQAHALLTSVVEEIRQLKRGA